MRTARSRAAPSGRHWRPGRASWPLKQDMGPRPSTRPCPGPLQAEDEYVAFLARLAATRLQPAARRFGGRSDAHLGARWPRRPTPCCRVETRLRSRSRPGNRPRSRGGHEAVCLARLHYERQHRRHARGVIDRDGDVEVNFSNESSSPSTPTSWPLRCRSPFRPAAITIGPGWRPPAQTRMNHLAYNTQIAIICSCLQWSRPEAKMLTG